MSRKETQDRIKNEMIVPLDDAIRKHLVVNSAAEPLQDRAFKQAPYEDMRANKALVACLNQASTMECLSQMR